MNITNSPLSGIPLNDTGANEAPDSLPQRYLLAQVGSKRLAFPLKWVSELILVQQSQILSLPFYDAMLLGVYLYRGDVMPLIIAPSGNQTAAVAQRLRNQQKVTAVRLNQAVGRLAGIGVLVDRVIERFASTAQNQLSSEVQIFQLEDIPSTIWQPHGGS